MDKLIATSLSLYSAPPIVRSSVLKNRNKSVATQKGEPIKEVKIRVLNFSSWSNGCAFLGLRLGYYI